MTAGDFAALLASAKVTSRDTIHLGLDRKVLKAHARKLKVKVGETARKLFA
jgi:hypothetical protein